MKIRLDLFNDIRNGASNINYNTFLKGVEYLKSVIKEQIKAIGALEKSLTTIC